MSSRADSWGSITLVFSTALSRYLSGERSVKLMELLGWHSTVYACKEASLFGLVTHADFSQAQYRP